MLGKIQSVIFFVLVVGILLVVKYGRDAIKIEKNFIVVTIPFNRINVTPFELNEGQPTINPTVKATVNPTVNPTVNFDGPQYKDMPKPLRQVLHVISRNPHATYAVIAKAIGKSRDTVSQYLSKLQEEYKLIKRVGSDKTGYWLVIDAEEPKDSPSKPSDH